MPLPIKVIVWVIFIFDHLFDDLLELIWHLLYNLQLFFIEIIHQDFSFVHRSVEDRLDSFHLRSWIQLRSSAYSDEVEFLSYRSGK